MVADASSQRCLAQQANVPTLFQILNPSQKNVGHGIARQETSESTKTTKAHMRTYDVKLSVARALVKSCLFNQPGLTFGWEEQL